MAVSLKMKEKAMYPMFINYLNTVVESLNTVKFALSTTVLGGGFVAKVLTEIEGMWVGYNKWMCSLGLFSFLQSVKRWSDEMIGESRYLGKYTKKLATELLVGGVLFIASEIFLFSSLAGTIIWLGAYLSEIVPAWLKELVHMLWASTALLSEPGVATGILLMSAFCFNAFLALVKGYDMSDFLAVTKIITQVLGAAFLMFQLAEYTHFDASIFTTVLFGGFFMVTGFHGLHVLIGWGLFVIQQEGVMDTLQSTNNVGLFFSNGYWHFVDIVWLFVLYTLYNHLAGVYVGGSTDLEPLLLDDWASMYAVGGSTDLDLEPLLLDGWASLYAAEDLMFTPDQVVHVDVAVAEQTLDDILVLLANVPEAERKYVLHLLASNLSPEEKQATRNGIYATDSMSDRVFSSNYAFLGDIFFVSTLTVGAIVLVSLLLGS